MTTQPNDKTPAPDGSTTDTQHLPALRPAPAQQREPESRVPGETTKTRRGRWFRYTLPGSWVALVFVCLSFTPSLLPRSWLLQAIVCGINGSIGYGLGVVGASVWRAFADRDPRPARRRSWAIFFVTAVVALPLAAAVGQWWQRQLRELMGVPSEFTGLVLLLPVVAAAVFVGILAVSRSLRTAYRWLSRLLGQWIGLRAARVLGWAIVLTTTVMVVNGVILDGLASMAAAHTRPEPGHPSAGRGLVRAGHPGVANKHGGRGRGPPQRNRSALHHVGRQPLRVLGQDREHAVRRERMPSHRLRVEQLPLITGATLHAHIDPAPMHRPGTRTPCFRGLLDSHAVSDALHIRLGVVPPPGAVGRASLHYQRIRPNSQIHCLDKELPERLLPLDSDILRPL